MPTLLGVKIDEQPPHSEPPNLLHQGRTRRAQARLAARMWLESRGQMCSEGGTSFGHPVTQLCPRVCVLWRAGGGWTHSPKHPWLLCPGLVLLPPHCPFTWGHLPLPWNGSPGAGTTHCTLKLFTRHCHTLLLLSRSPLSPRACPWHCASVPCIPPSLQCPALPSQYLKLK